MDSRLLKYLKRTIKDKEKLKKILEFEKEQEKYRVHFFSEPYPVGPRNNKA